MFSMILEIITIHVQKDTHTLVGWCVNETVFIPFLLKLICFFMALSTSRTIGNTAAIWILFHFFSKAFLFENDTGYQKK